MFATRKIVDVWRRKLEVIPVAAFSSGRNLVGGLTENSGKSKKEMRLMADVHGTTHGKREWRNKPLFRREGDKKFSNGMEAAEMLAEEAYRKDPYQTDFCQAVEAFLYSISPVFDRYPKYAWVMKQLLEPERVIQFRVPWVDDTGNHRVNRGFRVQYSSSLGPYMGGLRFHRDVGHGTVKFLGFESVFRNAVAGPFGGAAGGSDFNPVNKTEAEVMRFCQSFMTELANYIGPHTDIPTAGLGVGQTEIGYMFGQYKRIRQLHPGGSEGIISGGQYLYPQLTGHGVAHYADIALKDKNLVLKGKKCLVSGAGVVALHTADKLIDLGAIPIAVNDFSGTIHEPEGLSKKNIEELLKIKSERSSRVGGYMMSSTSARYYPAEESNIWDIPCDFAFPCSVQNDIDTTSAKKLIKNGCKGVFEGANMPCTIEASQTLKDNNIIIGPSRIVNIAALSMTHLTGNNTIVSPEDLDTFVRNYVENVYHNVSATASQFDVQDDLQTGANIHGFIKVAEAMLSQGAV